MKRNAIQIGLGLLVMGVWGAVVTKAFRRAGPPPITHVAPAAIVPTGPDLDTLDLRIPTLRRDPFANRPEPIILSQQRIGSSSHAPKPPLLPPPASPRPAWPNIAYKGLLRPPGDDARRRVAFLSVAGKDAVVAQGGEWNGLRVVALARDSIILERNGEQRSFKRQ